MSIIGKPSQAHAEGVTPLNFASQALEFHSRPYSLTEDDIAALEALAPTLDGVWTCEILVNDDGDRWAMFKGHHAPPLVIFVVRNGRRLRLINMDAEALVTVCKMDKMTTLLGDAIGRRHVALV